MKTYKEVLDYLRMFRQDFFFKMPYHRQIKDLILSSRLQLGFYNN